MDSYAQGLSLAEAYWAMTVRLRPELARVFERLAVLSRRGPVVAHCFSGKDRAGLVSALLLDAAGVERGAIAEDYLEGDVPGRAVRQLVGRRWPI